MHDQHATLGAKMADFGGWEMPIEYHRGGVLNEHAAVREAVGLFDVSHLGKLTVTGYGAVEFLNSQFTNDLMRIGADKAQYSMLCNEAGGVVDDLIVYRRSDRDVFVIPNASNAAEVFATLQAAAPESVAIADRHADFGVLAVQGPKANAVLAELGISTDLGYMQFDDAKWQGTTVTICRTGYTGELGYELLPILGTGPSAVGRAPECRDGAGRPTRWTRGPRHVADRDGISLARPRLVAPDLTRAGAIGVGRWMGQSPVLRSRFTAY